MFFGAMWSRFTFLMVPCFAFSAVFLVCADDVDESNETRFSSKGSAILDVSIDDLHAKGVEAYLSNEWDVCSSFFEEALEEYRELKQSTINCRMECSEKMRTILPMFPVDTENLHFFESMIRKTRCLLNCRKRSSKGKFTFITPPLEKMYEALKPYEYLHLCYYQQKQHQKAASAAFTFLGVGTNSNHTVMVQNLMFYTNMSEVNREELVNFEEKKFEQIFTDAVRAYEEQDYTAAVTLFEESLYAWLKSAEECRTYCEAPFDHGWFPEFTLAVANHFTFCLRCKSSCENKLNILKGQQYDDFLPRHYHYLQISYYKVGDVVKACEAAESYLLFFPNDELMLHNQQFYRRSLGENEPAVAAREEAKQYVYRKHYESKLLEYIDTVFMAEHLKSVENSDSGMTGDEMFLWDDGSVEKSCMIDGSSKKSCMFEKSASESYMSEGSTKKKHT